MSVEVREVAAKVVVEDAPHGEKTEMKFTVRSENRDWLVDAFQRGRDFLKANGRKILNNAALHGGAGAASTAFAQALANGVLGQTFLGIFPGQVIFGIVRTREGEREGRKHGGDMWGFGSLFGGIGGLVTGVAEGTAKGAATVAITAGLSAIPEVAALQIPSFVLGAGVGVGIYAGVGALKHLFSRKQKID